VSVRYRDRTGAVRESTLSAPPGAWSVSLAGGR
jgi:hypothetical protein